MKAIVGKRVESGSPDLEEISELAEAAGYDVVGTIRQTRREDPAFGFGEGKLAELRVIVEQSGAEVVILDNQMGPYQIFNIAAELPEGVVVIDRFTLILEIFAQRAKTRKAQLQVELAELRYELPRVSAKVSLAKRDEHPGFMGLGEYDETRERDIKARISRIQEDLDRIANEEETWRTKRRESGFDLVALAGYTNAGKSTVLRRLASALEVDQNDGLHPDLDPIAESRDQLFTTLGTTTRRAEMHGRDVLVTDTVGFIRDLPHWLVESFRSTLEQVYHADLVLLVVDISLPVSEIRDRLVTSHDTLYERNQAPLITVYNKTDLLSSRERAERVEALSDLAPEPVLISAEDGTGFDQLQERIVAQLAPLHSERLIVPMTDDTMQLISWIHDNAIVDDVTYANEEAILEYRARPAAVSRVRSWAADLAAPITE